MKQKIVCFGETLWDILPNAQLPGGAPMNVAIHLQYQGFFPLVISRVGTDELGTALLAYLHEKGVSTQLIQKDPVHQTGIVLANVSNKTEVTYQIVESVAWDFITYEDNAAERVKNSDVFIFGSLSARSQTSRHALLKYLENASLKVFDVNFRAPHYSPNLVTELLGQANLVKMNHHELQEIMGWLGMHPDQQRGMQVLKDRFNLAAVIVTRGENGAIVLTEEGFAEHPGFRVEVDDTIGSGDAFLATFLSNYLGKQPMTVALERACKIGAYVATQKGATPFYRPEELEGLHLVNNES